MTKQHMDNREALAEGIARVALMAGVGVMERALLDDPDLRRELLAALRKRRMPSEATWTLAKDKMRELRG